MTKLRPPSPLYNPGGASDEDFLSGFVARKGLLEQLLNGLRAIARGGSSEHQLLVGQRGMGKSSLLRAVAARVAGDAALEAAFAPLRFREEQYCQRARRVLAQLWRGARAMVRGQWARRSRAPPRRRDRDARLARRGQRGDRVPRRLRGGGKARDPARRRDLDLILDALKPGEPWALRRVLQMPDGPIVIGASVVFLKESSNRDAAFYEFFHPHVLEPVDERELMTCLRALADRAGEAGDAVKVVLEARPAGCARSTASPGAIRAFS